MAALSLTYTLTNGTLADASKVQQNFTDILNYVNASTIRTDGANAMTAALLTDNVNPTVAAHAVRKGYMDGAYVQALTGSSQNFTNGVWKTLLFATETSDLDNGAAATNYNLATGVFTVPRTGAYLLVSHVFHDSLTSSGFLYSTRYSVNSGATLIVGPEVVPNQTPLADPTQSWVSLYYATVADTIELQGKVNSTVTRTMARRFTATWLHA